MKKAALLLINKDDKFLLFQRDSYETTNPGKWGLLGGGIEEGETPEVALTRELEEEAGVKDFTNFKKLDVYSNDGVELHVYYTTTFPIDKIKLNHEHRAQKWFTQEDVETESKVIPTNVTFIKDYKKKNKLNEQIQRMKILL